MNEAYPARGGSSIGSGQLGGVATADRQPAIPMYLQQLEHKLAMLSGMLDEHEKKIDHIIYRRPEPPNGELQKPAPEEAVSQVAENLRAACRAADGLIFRLRRLNEAVQL